MSDVGVSDAVDGVQGAIAIDTVTAGTMMREAREAMGLHVAALAVSMKIPVKKLEALEADRLDLLHDAVFVRALAASVCRTLKIDSAPILDKLPQNTAPKLAAVERGINAPFRATSYTKGVSVPESLTKPSALAFFALVLAGIAVFFLPDTVVREFPLGMVSQAIDPSDNPNSSLVTQPSIPMSNASPDVAGFAPSAPQPAIETASPVQSVAASAPPVVASQAAVFVDSSQSVVAASPQSGSLPLLAASSPSRAASLPSTGTVIFKAKGETWVKVVDAKGFVQLSKTLAGGEVVGASGSMPLSVVIGRVDATEVEVRGEAFNLSSVSRDNVARFEVK